MLAAGILEDSTEEPGGCLVEVEHDADCADKVYGVRVTGYTDSTGEDPGEVTIKSPGACIGNYNLDDSQRSGADDVPTAASGQQWVAEAADTAVCPEVSTDVNNDLTCNSADQAQFDTWQVFLPPHSSGDCTQHDRLEVKLLLGSEDDCQTPPSPPSNACAPATNATVDLYHRSVFNEGGDATSRSHLLPIVKSGPNYSERAWLRKLTVSNWGDATELYVLKTGHGIHYEGDDVVHDNSVIKLTPQSPTATLPAGVAHMATTFAVDSMPTGVASWAPPKLTMDWSCEVNPQSPHYQVRSGLPQAYAVQLGQLGVQGMSSPHRVKLRIYDDRLASLEFEGRHDDAVFLPVTATSNGYTFDRDDGGTIGIDVKGTIAPDGLDKKVVFERLVLRGHSLGAPTVVFAKVNE